MFKTGHPRYFHNSQGTRLFINTNFPENGFDPKKTLLVFNYGLVCNNEHWAPQIRHFDQLGFPILIHDYRAHYNSSGKDRIDQCTFKNIASDIKEILNAIGAVKTLHLGHSMGVNVTLEFARSYPELMVGQVLISGTVVPPQDVMFDTNLFDLVLPYIEMAQKKYPKFYLKMWTTSFMNPLIRKIIFDGGFNTKQVSQDFIHVYLKRIGELPPELFLQLVKEMHDHDVINDLPNMKVPTLIMGGDKDNVIPNYLQNILYENLPSSELYVIKDGSHVPQVDFPATINQRIHYFIEKSEAPGKVTSSRANIGTSA